MQGCDGSAHYSGGVLEDILTLIEAFVREGRSKVEVVTRISPVFLENRKAGFFALGESRAFAGKGQRGIDVSAALPANIGRSPRLSSFAAR